MTPSTWDMDTPHKETGRTCYPEVAETVRLWGFVGHTDARFSRAMKSVHDVADHCNVVGNELSNGDGKLAGAEGVVHRWVQWGRCHSILHAAHHVLPVLLAGLCQAQHFLQV